MCRSGVARGHFTLMAAGPIEMTAALHDLKVRRQRIIFQWWRRGIGGVKWCLSPPTPPPYPPRAELLRNSQDGISIAPKPAIITLTRGTPWKQIALLLSFLRPYIIMRNTASENSEALFVKINNTTNHPARSAARYGTAPL